MTTLTFNTDKDLKNIFKNKPWLKMFAEINRKKDDVPSHLTYKPLNCFINAWMNKRHAYKDLNLKYVIGALGFNGWVEYGGKDWTKEKYLSTFDAPHSIDAHAWLEDKDGNVYDFCFHNYSLTAFTRTNKPLSFSGLLEKKSKEECEALGLSYYPASKDTQTAIFLLMHKHLAQTEQNLLTGKAKWDPSGHLSIEWLPENREILINLAKSGGLAGLKKDMPK